MAREQGGQAQGASYKASDPIRGAVLPGIKHKNWGVKFSFWGVHSQAITDKKSSLLGNRTPTVPLLKTLRFIFMQNSRSR